MKIPFNELQIKRLGTGDTVLAQQLFRLMNAVFNEAGPQMPSELYLETLLTNPVFYCYIAIYQGKVTGGLTAYELPMYNAERSEIFIYDIAIKPEYQRRGFGSVLVQSLIAHGEATGKTIFVNADKADQHALDFYRSLNGEAAKVVQFTFGV